MPRPANDMGGVVWCGVVWWWQLEEQAVQGATLEIMDGPYRDVLRQITTFTRSNSTLSLAVPLSSQDRVQVEEQDLAGSPSALENTSYVRLQREAASQDSVVLGWEAVRDVKEYTIQARHSSSGVGGADLDLKPFYAVATVGSAGSAERACKGLKPRESVSHLMPVDSYTKRVANKLNVGGEGAEGGSAGVRVGADLVCFEVTGLVRGSLYEFQVVAKNNNVDASPPSKSFFYTPTPKPPTSPPWTSIAVVQQDSTSLTLHWLPPQGQSAGKTTGYRVEIRRLGDVAWEARPLKVPSGPHLDVPNSEWQQYGVEQTLEEGMIERVDTCAVLQLSGLQLSQDAEPLSYANAALFIGHEVRRIVAVSVNATAGPVPPAAPGHGGVVNVDACFTQVLKAGQKYSVVRGYRITGLTRGAGYAVKVYAVNSAGAAHPPACAVIPPTVQDLKVVRVRSSAISLRWTMPGSAKAVRVLLANASLPDLYTGGRWGAGAHAVGDGLLPPVFVTLDPPYSSGAPTNSYILTPMQLDLDGAKLPWLRENMHLRFRIVAAARPEGPYEGIGAEIGVSTAGAPPHADSIWQLKLIGITRSSFTLQWLFSPTAALPSNASYPAFVAIQVCTVSSCLMGAAGGGGFFPNGSSAVTSWNTVFNSSKSYLVHLPSGGNLTVTCSAVNCSCTGAGVSSTISPWNKDCGCGCRPASQGLEGLVSAAKFAVMDQGASFAGRYSPFVYHGLAVTPDARVGSATVFAAGGAPLQEGVEYWVRVYPGNFFDNDDDGTLTRSEGFSTAGSVLSADFASGGAGGGGFFLGDRADAARELRSVSVDANTARLRWLRGGVKGSKSLEMSTQAQMIHIK